MRNLKVLVAVIWVLAALLLLGVVFLVLPRLKETMQPVAMPTLLVPPTAAPPTPTPFATDAALNASPAPTETPAASVPASPTPTALIYVPHVAANVDPLTGLIVSDMNRLERRPIAVKVTHFPRSVRPNQAGLTLADVVYEYYIEDGITRFIAVFYGNDAERIGPVRSGRYFDEHVARMYQAFLVYASADDRVNDYLLHTDLLPRIIIPGTLNCPPLCRDTSIPGFNNMFLNTTQIADWARQRGVTNTRPDLQATFFSDTLPLGGQEVSRIFVWYSGYSYHYWEYLSAQGRYLRYSDTVDAIGDQSPQYEIQRDALTGQAVMADNVVILFVPHGFNNDFDRADQLYRIDLMDSGRAILFREGRAYDVFWRRRAIDQPIQLTDPAYNPIPLKRGETFYIVLPADSTLTRSHGDWYFDAVIPGWNE